MGTPEIGRGVLYPGTIGAVSDLARYEPGPAVAGFVEFYWHVRWDVPGPEPYATKVLSHPNVHLVFEDPAPLIYGVQRALFVRRLHGRGQVLGVKFRPGGFRALFGAPVAGLLDRTIPAAEIFGPEVDDVSRAVLAGADGAAMSALAEDFLRTRLPAQPDPVAVRVAAMVERIMAEPAIFRVDQAADALDVPIRRLQRLFAEYVGAGPKWVLRRARLHEVAARADQAAGIDWAALAADLGYVDQAHLTRDFTAAVGDPPATYSRA
jgi:AraC-like DNA-binding protein